MLDRDPTQAVGQRTAGSLRRPARSVLAPILVLVGLAVVAAIAFLVLPTVLQEMKEPAPKQAPAIPGLGMHVPSLDFKPLTGNPEPVTLQSIAGKVTIVNFWGTWCGPCRVELPELVELGKQFASHPDFRLVLVSSGPGGPEDYGELKAETEAFLEASHIDLPTHWDPNHKTAAVLGRVTRMQVFPTTIVLDRDGVIRGVWPGYHPRCVAEMRETVLGLLNGESAAPKSSEPPPAKGPA